MEEVLADALRWLDLPWWQLAAIVAGTTVASVFLGGRLPVWARPLLSAVRVAALAAMRRKPTPKLPRAASLPPGEPITGLTASSYLDPSSDVVDTPVSNVRGRTDEEIDADSKNGDGGG